MAVDWSSFPTRHAVPPKDYLTLIVRESAIDPEPDAVSHATSCCQADQEHPDLGRGLAVAPCDLLAAKLAGAQATPSGTSSIPIAAVLINMYGITETTVHVTHL